MKDKTTVLLSVAFAAFCVSLFVRYFLVKKEGFFQQEVGAPLVGEDTGSYAGIDISNGNAWSSTSAPTPLKSYEAADDNEIYAFQKSTFKPECCPAGITNDVGCVCMSESEEKQLAYRGGNRVSA